MTRHADSPHVPEDLNPVAQIGRRGGPQEPRAGLRDRRANVFRAQRFLVGTPDREEDVCWMCPVSSA